MKAKHITQGEFATGTLADEVITTILGSCVSACLWDPVSGVGGMNHILLPEGPKGGPQVQGAGVNAMELLINAIIHKGGAKERLVAKLFGGGKMISRFSDVGIRNAEFVLAFLDREGIECRSQSLGGEQARRIQFWPHSGRARQKLLGRMDIHEEPASVILPDTAAEVELF